MSGLFDPTTTEMWDVSTDTILPIGNHAVKITEAEAGTSKGGFPEGRLKYENAQGTVRDWIVISPSSNPGEQPVGFRKAVTVFDRAGIDMATLLPHIDQETGAIAQAGWDLLVGKTVGVVIYQEPDNRDPTKVRTRVKGVVPAEQLGANAVRDSGVRSDIPNDVPAGSGGRTLSDDEIPFLHDGFPSYDERNYHSNR
jgi:hypothetical protein